jgi:hypothetical protein
MPIAFRRYATENKWKMKEKTSFSPHFCHKNNLSRKKSKKQINLITAPLQPSPILREKFPLFRRGQGGGLMRLI